MPIGHSFSWHTMKSRWEDPEPPPDCKCAHCGQRYDEIESIHHCPVMIAQEAKKYGGIALVVH